jgi:hypothetical protein
VWFTVAVFVKTSCLYAVIVPKLDLPKLIHEPVYVFVGEVLTHHFVGRSKTINPPADPGANISADEALANVSVVRVIKGVLQIKPVHICF